MNSHEYARKMHEQADFLLSKPAFEVPATAPRVFFNWYGEIGKPEFLAAARALGTGTKGTMMNDFMFESHGIHLLIPRSLVCHKVQEEKWECEPLLTEEEEAGLGVGG